MNTKTISKVIASNFIRFKTLVAVWFRKKTTVNIIRFSMWFKHFIFRF